MLMIMIETQDEVCVHIPKQISIRMSAANPSFTHLVHASQSLYHGTIKYAAESQLCRAMNTFQ
jgi:hypothetical protein